MEHLQEHENYKLSFVLLTWFPRISGTWPTEERDLSKDSVVSYSQLPLPFWVPVYISQGTMSRFIIPVGGRPFVGWLIAMYAHLKPLRERNRQGDDYY